MTIQNNFPAIKPSLNLDFANTKQLDPRITFARASTARYYDGKTTAKAEENLLLQSQFVSSWGSSNVSQTVNATTAPDGTTTAISIIANTTPSVGHSIVQATGASAGNTYTYSVYAKANGYTNIQLFGDSSGNFTATFDLTAATAAYSGSATAATIVSVGNGWYRCATTFVMASVSRLNIQGFPTGATASNYGNTFTGDGTSGVYLWGAQLEQRSFATAYTPTTTAPITNYIPVLQIAAAGTPRFDHNPVTGESLGLLIEEQRTNLLTFSEQLDVPGWSRANANVQENIAVAPDGTMTAALLVEDTTINQQHYISRPTSVTSGSVTFSVYAKAAGRNWFRLQASTANALAWFNLSNGTLGEVQSGCTASIVPVGNGWYRCSATVQYVNQTCYIFLADANGSTAHTGNGYSGIYIWGAQLEAGAFATSYIPTALTYSGRASTATFRGPNGLLQTAAANVARSEVNAGGGSNLLLENAASNLLRYTENFDNAAWYVRWGGSGVVIRDTDKFTAPDGTQTVYKCVATSGGAGVGQAVTLTAGVAYTFSCWVNTPVNNAEIRFATLAVGGGTVAQSTIFSGSLLTRVSLTYTPTVTQTYYIGVAHTVAGQITYTWGAQLEAGSAETSYIPSLETFTGRASTATYYDSTGIVRSAASGQPRYSYNPALLSVAPKLLLEAQSTNLLIRSEQFDGLGWGRFSSTTVPNSITAPDGTTSADKLVENAETNQHLLQTNLPVTAASHTFSVYLKAAERTFAALILYDGVLDHSCYFDLAKGIVGIQAFATGSIVSVGNGWHRCSISCPLAAGTSFPSIRLSDVNGNVYYTGNGTSGIYVWGAQLEAGTAATSYIPTVESQVTRVADSSTSAAQSRAADVYSSAQVTRARDAATIPTTGWFYGSGEGTVYADINVRNTVFDPDTLYFGLYSSSATLNGEDKGFTLYANFNYLTRNPADTAPILNHQLGQNKIAIAMDALGKYGVKNGGTVIVNSLAGLNNTVGATVFSLGGNNANKVCQTIKKITYYPIRATNTQLQALTT
jgi:hypothetical protein